MNYIVIPASVEGLQPAVDFIKETLDEHKVRSNLREETILIFEELFTDIIDNGSVEGSTLRISLKKSFGRIMFLINFYGERFLIDLEQGDEMDPHTAILRAYEDRFTFNYRRRANTITINAMENHGFLSRVLICTVAVLASYFVLIELFSPEALMNIRSYFLTPLIDSYLSAGIMVSAPVTFFSLVKNISDVNVTLDGRKSIKRTFLSVGAISIVGIVVAFIFVYAANTFTGSIINHSGLVSTKEIAGELPPLYESIKSLVPSDIVEAFTVMNPGPLIFMGLITAISICSMDKHFKMIKDINDALCSLFCKMLLIIMWFMPAFAVLSVLSLMIKTGPKLVSLLLYFIILSVLSVTVLFSSKLIALKAKGVKLLPFLKKCIPVMRENFNFNSSIDAVPYNSRFCNSSLKVKKSIIDLELPILAQVSLCGNCLLITLLSIITAECFGISLSAEQMIIVAFIAFALSIGAPNQPGSFFVGMTIIFSYFQLPVGDMAIIIVIEALVGRFATFLNTMSDIITVYSHEMDRRNKVE